MRAWTLYMSPSFGLSHLRVTQGGEREKEGSQESCGRYHKPSQWPVHSSAPPKQQEQGRVLRHDRRKHWWLCCRTGRAREIQRATWVPPEYLWSTDYGIQRLVCACVYTNAQVQFRKKELGKKVGNMTQNVSKGYRSSPSINTSHFRGHVSATQGINQAVRNVTWKKP